MHEVFLSTMPQADCLKCEYLLKFYQYLVCFLKDGTRAGAAGVFLNTQADERIRGEPVVVLVVISKGSGARRLSS